MHPVGKAALGVTAAGVAGLTYAAGYEVRAFRLRRADIACLPPGSRPLKILHISDLHLTPTQRAKQDWVNGLAALEPDLLVNTGDTLSHPDAIPDVMKSLGDLRDLPGVYVFGSNDYWAPVFKNPMRYFLPNGGKKKFHGPELPWRDLKQAFDDVGWVDLDNERSTLSIHGTEIAFAGVDDPHLGYDRLEQVAGPADTSADLRIAVTHAPYLRVLDQFTGDGYDVILAGHTHGGQLRVPGYGALVTNCDIDRRRSRGLHQHTRGENTAWLNVSAGLGTSPYTPIRFCCHPEATLLTLTAGTDQ
jgi:predicted MPP superfamily phosphohydrolase